MAAGSAGISDFAIGHSTGVTFTSGSDGFELVLLSERKVAKPAIKMTRIRGVAFRMECRIASLEKNSNSKLW